MASVNLVLDQTLPGGVLQNGRPSRDLQLRNQSSRRTGSLIQNQSKAGPIAYAKINIHHARLFTTSNYFHMKYFAIAARVKDSVSALGSGTAFSPESVSSLFSIPSSVAFPGDDTIAACQFTT